MPVSWIAKQQATLNTLLKPVCHSDIHISQKVSYPHDFYTSNTNATQGLDPALSLLMRCLKTGLPLNDQGLIEPPRAARGMLLPIVHTVETD